ncbi:M56 family metallopeptidase [Microlunatus elymi]|uniref:M56 family metallopeptidase n=1 Tax=Microlunatus elymi TaxID=2596828 RepID=A0A516PTX7_9ACTN|nr:M56 family metallopeptidase [Microlunatus elymi]QDP94655.1 M56 family metallopeptidase [Microlunatus elymi]
MIIALALAAYAVITLVSAPQLLTRGHWRVHYPRLCLSLWYLLFLTGVAAAVASGTVAVWEGWRIQVDGDTLANSFGFGAVDWIGPATRVVGGIIGWSALAIGGALISLVATRTQKLILAQRRIRAEVNELVARAGYRRELIAGTPVTYVTSRRLIACGLHRRHATDLSAAQSAMAPSNADKSGASAEVIVSSGLDLALSADELRAVVEHERAHLRGGHLIFSRLAVLNQACLPTSRTARELGRATGLLIELIADDAAARRCGGRPLVSALTKIAEAEHDPTLGLRAWRIRQRLALAA